jgi:putrescine transport system permease protein
VNARRLLIGLSAAWLGLFLLWPLAIVLRIALAEPRIAQPPYSPLLERGADGGWQILLGFQNFALLFEEPLYLEAWANAIGLAGAASLLCLLLAYPMAAAIAACRPALRRLLLALIILPFWTSFLLRVYAFIGLLGPHGHLNHLLLYFGLIDEPLAILHTPRAVLIGMVYTYLPFMLMPIYASLEKRDPVLLEAARDLGASPLQTFLKVTLPLSTPGIQAGILLVFVPALGEFVIPDLLGGPGTPMIGHVLWTEFFANRAWPVAAALAVSLLLASLAVFLALKRLTRGADTRQP